VDTTRPDVVLGVEVVVSEKHGLKNVDSADCDPSEADDESHDEALSDESLPCVGESRDAGQDGERAGDEEDGACGAGEVSLHTPSGLEVGGALSFFALEDAEEKIVREVREDDR